MKRIKSILTMVFGASLLMLGAAAPVSAAVVPNTETCLKHYINPAGYGPGYFTWGGVTYNMAYTATLRTEAAPNSCYNIYLSNASQQRCDGGGCASSNPLCGVQYYSSGTWHNDSQGLHYFTNTTNEQLAATNYADYAPYRVLCVMDYGTGETVHWPTFSAWD
ncbi:MAG TPA: hypothetical protein VLF69_04745 [Candidatus Saccharimonadales bacterium]|nr:hypothetical protein [Candidatus Saccharimonadales bacterium]